MPDLRFELIDGRSEPEWKNILGAARRDRKEDQRLAKEDVADAMLLRNLANGDKAAMHILFSRHRARMLCLVQRMVIHPAMVDDLVSHAFLDLWRSARRLESAARVSGWLLAIARLKAVSSVREPTHKNIDWQACVGKLSPAHREIIHLFYDREKSVAEIAKMAGIPRAVVRSRLFYARKRLARILVSAGLEAAAVGTHIKKQNAKKESRASCEGRQIRGRPPVLNRNAHKVMTVPRESTL